MSWHFAYQSACEADKALPREELVAHEELTSLVLNGNAHERFSNRVDDKELATLCKALSSAPAVTEVDLSYNKISDEGAIALADVLKRNTTIQFISLAHNDIGTAGARALADALMLNMTVATLSLRNNPIGDAGGLAFGTMLRGNNTLQSLDLGCCELQTKALVSVALALLSHPVLCSIKLDKPLLRGPQEVHTVVQHLCQTIARNNKLVELSLDYFGLYDDHIAVMTPPLVQNEMLKSLSLAGNKLTVDGAMSLVKVLSRRPDIVNLNLNGNIIDDGGAVALALAVRSHPSLERLSLLNTALGDRGLVAIVDAVAASRSLRQLYLWGNDFTGPRAATAVWQHKAKLEALDYIDIEWYTVDDKPKICQRND